MKPNLYKEIAPILRDYADSLVFKPDTEIEVFKKQLRTLELQCPLHVNTDAWLEYLNGISGVIHEKWSSLIEMRKKVSQLEQLKEANK